MQGPKKVGKLMLLSSLAILSILLTSSAMQSSAFAAAAGPSTSCTSASLDSQIVAAGQPVSDQSAISLAEKSPQYGQTATSMNLSFEAVQNSWGVTSNCKIYWQDLDVNFEGRATNGSQFTISVTENPETGVIIHTSISPASYASISPNNDTTYSGYGVAQNNNQDDEAYYADAYWYVPTVSEPPRGQPQCTFVTTTHDGCILDTWAGLANTTYGGFKPTVPAGGVIQGGIQERIRYFSTNSSLETALFGWTEWLACSSGGSCSHGTLAVPCPSTDTVSTGDEVEATVANQLIENSTTGNTDYVFVHDWTQGWDCAPHHGYNVGGYGLTPWYSEYEAERAQNGTTQTAGSFNVLPEFTNFHFIDCATAFSNTISGAYTAYTSGDGWGGYMANHPTGSYTYTQDTTTRAMTNDGSGYGDFYEDWNSSTGT